jgi:AraC-like DNA-binding protein
VSRPASITPVKLTIAQTARLAGLARPHTAGLITRNRLAFALRWSLRRRLHQAIAMIFWDCYASLSVTNQP